MARGAPRWRRRPHLKNRLPRRDNLLHLATALGFPRRGRTPTVTAKRGIGGCRLIYLHRYALTAPSGCRLICIITFVMEIDRMKKLIVLTAAVALLSGVSMTTFAAKSPEEMCKAKAEKQHVSADKIDAFVKTCVEKHSKHAAKHPAPAAPAGGTAAPDAPETPAAPAMIADLFRDLAAS